MKSLRLAAATMALLLVVTTPLAEAGKPLKVFILAGQSNMVGLGSVETFPAIGMDPETAPMLREMQNQDGSPVTCDEVYIASANHQTSGKLTVGYGGGKGVRIGPELTFGIYAKKLLGEPVLIIKTAWGGKSLIGDFRPPSAGGELPTGEHYTMMMDYVKSVLKDPKSVYPDYDDRAGYDLAGFVWFQGYNDFVSQDYPITDAALGSKKSPKDYSEYTRLLGCLIRDVRKELNEPAMPFVVGVFGMEGKDSKSINPRIIDFRKAQAATAQLPEFKGNVVNVFTELYWPEEISALKAKETALMKGEVALTGQVAKAMQAYKEHQITMKKDGLSKGERKQAFRHDKELKERLLQAHLGAEGAKLLKVGVSQQGYHYWGSAKFYGQAGKAFAEAVVKLGASTR